MGEKLTDGERAFLVAVRDDTSVHRVFKQYDIGYGWAVEQRLVTKIGPPFRMDFRLTDAGREALSHKGT